MFIHVKIPDSIPVTDTKMENMDVIVQAVDPERQTFVKCRQKCAIKDPDLQKKLCANVFLDGALGLLEAWNMDKELQDFVAELTPDDINALMEVLKSYMGLQAALRHWGVADEQIQTFLENLAATQADAMAEAKVKTDNKRKEANDKSFVGTIGVKESYMNKPDDPLRRFLEREVYHN